MNRRNGILIVLLLGLMFLLTGGVMMGQEATPELTPPPNPLSVYREGDVTPPAVWEWLPLIVTIIGGIAVIGVLVIAYIAVQGQRDSFPPGAAESWERLYEKALEQANKTTTPVDDILLAIGEPLAKAIGEALRGSASLTIPAGHTRDSPDVRRGGADVAGLNDPDGIG